MAIEPAQARTASDEQPLLGQVPGQPAFSSLSAKALMVDTVGSSSIASPVSVEISLTSSDASEVIVPATVVILAGQLCANFDVTIVDDGETDGTQTATVTASASGFADGSAPIAVKDNDVHHFGWAPISSLQTAGVPFWIAVKAQDIDNLNLPAYWGPVQLSGAGDCGSVLLTPENAYFTGGEWMGEVTVYTACSNVQLSASDVTWQASWAVPGASVHSLWRFRAFRARG